ncbi:N-acetyl sugar amidotransferase [Xenorhabdus bovienii]|uniref:N-acetyl sugar amidotransferase n=1 Tax=Xenorhabdus bovienii TaxID=40576 RepID=UPI001EE11788|nr:N-acetyl sugar amidotransferase [Xenorhabdus bovienii]MCG3470212.1 N-acetyl sugar amidotransferase [Xenorhabdus bovienii]
MKFCKNCVLPDTKPGIVLDERGFCNACRTKEIKESINWDERIKDLDKIIDDIKKQNHPFYDCIVAVSGGKDSWFQAIMLAEKYGLKVLCVTLAAHLPTTEGIDNLNNMIKDLNVDHMKITIKPSVFRRIRQKCFLRQGEPNWAEHCAMFSSVVNTALIYEVPLVVWGEDISFEFGGLQRNYSKPSAIAINKSDLIKEKTILDWIDDDISERDVFFYKYPDYSKLKSAGIQSIYLGHFMHWYGRRNYEIVKTRGFTGRKAGPLPGNYIDYDNIDEKLCEINIWFKYLKFGFWRATDQTCYDIWNNRLTRDEAVDIVNRLQNEFPSNDYEDFLRFHNITQEEFWSVVEKFRNKDIWDHKDGKWELKYKLKKI